MRNSIDKLSKTEVLLLGGRLVQANAHDLRNSYTFSNPGQAMTKTRFFISVIIFATLLAGVHSTARPDQSGVGSKPAAGESPRIQSQKLRIEFDKNMRSRVVARIEGKEIPLGAFSASETVIGREHSWDDFTLESQSRERVTDVFGGGEKLTLTGSSGTLRKAISVTIYDAFPNLAVFDVSYTNAGNSKIEILGWTNNAYRISAQPGTDEVAFWSFQSGSYERRPNWVLPLHPGFYQKNYLGMNASDYGGGTPIVDVWRKDVGLGVGLVEPRPRIGFTASFDAQCKPSSRQCAVSP